MKLQRIEAGRHNVFTGYGAGYVAVNNVRHEQSVIVSPGAVAAWRVAGFAGLVAEDFGFIAELRAEIVILGTGAAQRFPRGAVARALASSGAGVEVMDTGAACRTYNILVAEERRVVAAILVGAEG
jgi:uncharacterized protein